jgi:hypothetical protein
MRSSRKSGVLLAFTIAVTFVAYLVARSQRWHPGLGCANTWPGLGVADARAMTYVVGRACLAAWGTGAEVQGASDEAAGQRVGIGVL